jgi:hypothetical protein
MDVHLPILGHIIRPCKCGNWELCFEDDVNLPIFIKTRQLEVPRKPDEKPNKSNCKEVYNAL